MDFASFVTNHLPIPEKLLFYGKKEQMDFNSWAEKEGHPLQVVPGTRLHTICRKNYTRESSRSSS